MNNQVRLSFPWYYPKDIAEEFNNLRIGDNHTIITIIPKRRPVESGGIGWEGIILFASFASLAFATGFFNELGKESYLWFKQKLFKNGKRLRSNDRFTFNIIIGEIIVFFDLTELDELTFIEAINNISNSLKTKEITKNYNGYIAKYDKRNQKWIIKKDSTFDV